MEDVHEENIVFIYMHIQTHVWTQEERERIRKEEEARKVEEEARKVEEEARQRDAREKAQKEEEARRLAVQAQESRKRQEKRRKVSVSLFILHTVLVCQSIHSPYCASLSPFFLHI